MAPVELGNLSGDLLVGNFGDGRILALDVATLDFEGYLLDEEGEPVEIDGLWDLIVGNGASLGAADRLYFSAGPEEETPGCLAAFPSPGTTCCRADRAAVQAAAARPCWTASADHAQLDDDRPVVGGAAVQGAGRKAIEAARHAAIYPERRHVARDMRRLTQPDVPKARQEGRPYEVEVAEDRRPERERPGDAPKLAPVQHLPVREVHVRHREWPDVENLADALDDGARLQRQHRRRVGQQFRAPRRKTMDPARQRGPVIMTAEQPGQPHPSPPSLPA